MGRPRMPRQARSGPEGLWRCWIGCAWGAFIGPTFEGIRGTENGQTQPNLLINTVGSVESRRERQGEGRALAAGSATQALAQAAGLLALLAIVTVLARRLSLAELGVYGLVATLAGYLLVLHNSVSVA